MFQLWPLGALSRWHLCPLMCLAYFFGGLPYFLTLQTTPGPSCSFPGPALESAISPRRRVHFPRERCQKPTFECWVSSVLPSDFAPRPVQWTMWGDLTHICTRVCIGLSVCLSVYVLNKDVFPLTARAHLHSRSLGLVLVPACRPITSFSDREEPGSHHAYHIYVPDQSQ